MPSFLRKLFPSANERELQKLEHIVDKIEALEPYYHAMKNSELQGQTAKLKERYASGETLDNLLPDAFAVMREAIVRVLHKRLFHVQLIGGIVLHQGRIAEMLTGEGKTFVAPLAAYLNALSGEGVHVVTVNDYLARYHGEMMGLVFSYLGMTVGLVVSQMNSADKRRAYLADVTYGTNNEFGFDYLRDNMVIHIQDQVQRPLHFAIVDEVDSILIDEARTPLIISGKGDKSTDLYQKADQFVCRLKPGEENDYEYDEKQRTVRLTDQGTAKAELFFDIANLGDAENGEISHHIQQGLKAHAMMLRDRDYIVKDDQIIIVDEFTGRLMIGRRFSEGLHQAIEAKEHVSIQNESKTLATITIQNYFRMYKKLAGMTGTAKTEEQEFKVIYNMDVVQIPTNRPMIRIDETDVVYRTEMGKFEAVIEDIARNYRLRRPVLVGTVSVEKSELLSSMLKKRGILHTVLNAKHHEKEAEIIAQAGKTGAVTIATNMAGRGTDILLGGNADFLARREMRQKEYADDQIEMAVSYGETEDEAVLASRQLYQELVEKYSQETEAEHKKVVALGGLYVIGTERHESRRIDNQLRGRSGRQGDPGSSRFYISLEDDIMRLFGSDRLQGLMNNIGMDDTIPLEFKMLSKQIENAQKRVEARNFGIRKSVLEYDDVMNQQRQIIYSQRASVLRGEDMFDAVKGMMESIIDRLIERHAPESVGASEWTLPQLYEEFQDMRIPIGDYTLDDEARYKLNSLTLKNHLMDNLLALYSEKEGKISDAGVDMREVERVVMLQTVDRHWMNHIDDMDQLRRGIGLRALGQQNPIVEYKFEGFDMFENMVQSIQEDTISLLFRIRAEKATERKQIARITSTSSAETASGPQKPVKNKPEEKIGRNSPCPCGSGKKYKNCCGKSA
ncbi:MAG: preprotein translocase subunit SecA [Christensenellales bacterium]